MVQFSAEARVISLLHTAQTGSGAQPAYHSVPTVIYFLGVKAAVE